MISVAIDDRGESYTLAPAGQRAFDAAVHAGDHEAADRALRTWEREERDRHLRRAIREERRRRRRLYLRPLPPLRSGDAWRRAPGGRRLQGRRALRRTVRVTRTTAGPVGEGPPPSRSAEFAVAAEGLA